MSWGFGLLLVKPLKWTVSALLGGGSVPLQEPFVLIELVKVCRTTIDHFESKTNKRID